MYTRCMSRKHSCETALLDWQRKICYETGTQGMSLLFQAVRARGSGTESKGDACRRRGGNTWKASEIVPRGSWSHYLAWL